MLTCIAIAATLMPTQSADPMIDYADELNALAREVENTLKQPIEYLEFDDDDFQLARRDFSIASSWPKPEFEQSLLRILENTHHYHIALQAMWGLLRYEHWNPDEVWQLKDLGGLALRRETPIYPDIEVLKASLSQRACASPQFTPYADPYCPNDLCTPKCCSTPNTGLMTISAAARQLREADPMTRLYALVTLAGWGIVLDVEPLTDRWPELSDDDRKCILMRFTESPPRVGAHRLQNALEALFTPEYREIHGGAIHGSILVALARTGSRVADQYAREFLGFGQPDHPHSDVFLQNYDPYVVTAFLINATTADKHVADKWFESPYGVWQAAALKYYVLHDDATDSIDKIVCSMFGQNAEYFAKQGNDKESYRRLLLNQASHSHPLRWDYLRRLIPALHRYLENTEPYYRDQTVVGFAVAIIRKFACTHFIDRHVLRNEIMTPRFTKMWLEWLEENDPRPSECRLDERPISMSDVCSPRHGRLEFVYVGPFQSNEP